MSHPSAWTASTVQDLTDCPFNNTVQAPQLVVSQPILVPVNASVSRRKNTKRVRSSTSRRIVSSFTLNVISMTLLVLMRLFAAGRGDSSNSFGQHLEDRGRLALGLR